ncbi:MAG: sensor histidine kinase [Bacteroidales bacterium]|nr:sensor histidine kinase [Bacteroidales bacterium]
MLLKVFFYVPYQSCRNTCGLHWIFVCALILFSSYSTRSQGLFLRDKEAAYEEIEIYCDSIVDYAMALMYSQPDSARFTLENLLDSVGERAGTRQIRIHTAIGASFHIQADYGQALDHYYKAIIMSSEMNDSTFLGNVYNNIGVVNLKVGNFKDALEYLHKAIAAYELTDRRDQAVSSYNNIGLVFNEINNPEKAKANFLLALKGFTDLSDSIGIAAALSNLGMTYVKEQQADSAFFYYAKAKEISTRNNNLYGLCISWQGKGNLYASLGDYFHALESYTESRDIARKISQSYQEAFAMLGMAVSLSETGDTGQALETAFGAMKIARAINNQILIYEGYETLSKIYEKKGELIQSLENYKEYVKRKDELVNQAVLHQIYNLELNSLHQTNRLQELQIKSQQLSISKKNSMLIFTLVVAGLVIIGLYLLYLNYQHKQKVKLQHAIIHLNEKKSRDAVEAEIQERQRIGRELHDGIGQMLSVARLHISAMQQKKQLSEDRKNELLNAAIHSVDEAFDELRNISHNLAPSLLSEKGLLEALKNLAAHINQSNQLHMTVEAFGLNGGIEHLVEHTVFRAIQELLNNTIKHASASYFNVQLIRGEKEITLMAEDNGKGFSLDQTAWHHSGGIKNIRSRVENLNGTIFIDSLSGRGTITTIVIPCKDRNEKL